MALLDDVKSALRISGTAYDTEVTDLINAATLDLSLSGINVSFIGTDDALIKRAISVYAKAHFGYNNPDADRFMKSYEGIKVHLALSGDYRVVE